MITVKISPQEQSKSPIKTGIYPLRLYHDIESNPLSPVQNNKIMQSNDKTKDDCGWHSFNS